MRAYRNVRAAAGKRHDGREFPHNADLKGRAMDAVFVTIAVLGFGLLVAFLPWPVPSELADENPHDGDAEAPVYDWFRAP
jgi:hypothetical protein